MLQLWNSLIFSVDNTFGKVNFEHVIEFILFPEDKNFINFGCESSVHSQNLENSIIEILELPEKHNSEPGVA